MNLTIPNCISSTSNSVLPQCAYQKFKAADIRSAVDEFLAHDWAGKTKIFHLAVSADLSDTKLADAVEAAALKCKRRNIDFIPYDKDRLSELLKPHPDLVDDFFDRPWVTAFCGVEAAQTLSRRRLTKEQRVRARRKLREIYKAHFGLVDVGLPASSTALRQAAPQLALTDRYVQPMVDALDIIVVPKADNSSVVASRYGNREGSSAEAAGPNTSPATLESSGFKPMEYRTKLELFDWISTVKLGVLLGAPGLGKSAALQFITLDLLSETPKHESITRKWGSYLPIFIPFAALARLLASENAVTVKGFFEGWLNKLGVPAETISLLNEALEDERLLVIVDGLDEWTDQSAAAAARLMLLNFVLPRGLPVLAAARPLGYERLGALGSEWKKAELRPLESEQQTKFTRVWFEHFHRAALSPRDSVETALASADRQTQAFMAEVQADSELLELSGIPLLLSALIYLRLSGRILPHNRFDALEEISSWKPTYGLTAVMALEQALLNEPLQTGSDPRYSSRFARRMPSHSAS